MSPGTELAIYTGAHMGFSLPEPPFPLMPHRPGYALVGEVTALGSDVQRLAVGQRVLMETGHGTVAVADTRTQGVMPVLAAVPWPVRPVWLGRPAKGGFQLPVWWLVQGRLVDGSRVEALLAANVPPQGQALWLRAQPDRVHGLNAAGVRIEIDGAIAVEVQA